MAENLLSPLFPAAVQAILPAGRSEGGKRGGIPQRGSEDALGRFRGTLAGAGRKAVRAGADQAKTCENKSVKDESFKAKKDQEQWKGCLLILFFTLFLWLCLF